MSEYFGMSLVEQQGLVINQQERGLDRLHAHLKQAQCERDEALGLLREAHSELLFCSSNSVLMKRIQHRLRREGSSHDSDE